ncbi:aryl hydrocarbon receptor 2 [Osmerus mordax]|uniref:aryl hydrocarbon receptor 2 n=1 Tax=Osmerus mordax TaxID=8014 RepID=UPI00350EEBE2
MLGNVALYAAKKRKKPVQKVPKPNNHDGIKSNPSKRHRDRLNGELDKLTNLLPFSDDVRARLDKLSVLRLSVGYLKVKSYFSATMKKNSSMWGGNRQTNLATTATSLDGVNFSEGDLLLQALNGFVLVVTAEGYVFYSSPTIQDYLGFHQSDVVHQSVFELIHTDDRAVFRRELHFALNPNQFEGEQGSEVATQSNSSDITSNIVSYSPEQLPPENSSFLERSFVCRFRCLLDNSSGFLALNFHGRLKYLQGQTKVSEDGTISHPQLALFVIATPLQPPSILEIRAKTLLFQTKHKLDFSPMGIDTRGKVVLGYSEIELCMRGSGYQFIHAADMMYCADNHVKMIKTGESGLTVFRLLTKGGTWVWVQANARLVYKTGRPDFIVARQRALTNEEGEEHLRVRRLQLPFNFATGEGVLYEVGPSLDIADIPTQCKAPKIRKVVEDLSLDPSSLLGSLLQQDQSFYQQTSDPNSMSTLNDVAFKDSHALTSVPGDTWQHPLAKPSTLLKEEATLQDMMETLQQIIGDDSVCSTLNVDPVELKDWENTLLKVNTMNANSCDLPDDLNEILSSDIFSYVEDHLLQVSGLQRPDQLPSPGGLGHPLLEPLPCLPILDLQPPLLPGNQNFNWTMEPQSQFLGNRGPGSIGSMMKLTHIAPHVSSGALNGPLQPTATNNTFSLSLGGVDPRLNTPNSLGLKTQAGFNPALEGSCSRIQNQLMQNLQASQVQSSSPWQNGLGSGSLRQMQPGSQTTGRQLHPSAVTVPIQNFVQQGVPTQAMGFQNSGKQSNHLGPCQENQWMPSISKSAILETYGQSISSQQDIIVDPLSRANCLQEKCSLQTQNNMNQRQSWQQQQEQQRQLQQLPISLQNGHKAMDGRFNKVPEFQRDSLPGQVPQNSQHYQAMYQSQMHPNVAFTPLEDLGTQSLVPSNSCMFQSQSTVPVNKVQGSNTGLGSLGPSCQRMMAPESQSSSQASCYFQRNPNPSGPAAETSASPQEDAAINAVSCQLTPGLPTDSLLSQQHYLNCNPHTQIKSSPMEENGLFPLPTLPSQTTYFSENSQTNCCDF